MTIENDFLPFAAGAGANVLTQAQYAALAALSSGIGSGTASSAQANKTWRQASIMTSVIAQFIVAQSGQPAIDDGTTATLLANFEAALQAFAGASGNTPVIGDARNAQMNLTSAAFQATFTADEIVVGSALGGTSHKIGSFSQVINLGATGAGGMDTGTPPASGYVAIYAIYNPTSGTSALLATNATSSAAPTIYGGAHMPAGYTMSALVSVWPTNGSNQFVVGLQRGRRISITSTQALLTSSTFAVTILGIASIVPPNAIRVGGTMSAITTSVGVAILNIWGSTASVGLQSVVAGQAASEGVDSNYTVDMSSQQNIYFSITNTTGTPTFTINVSSYEF